MNANDNDYQGTTLAWRERPGTRREFCVTSPTALVAACGLTAAAPFAALIRPEAGAILGGAAMLGWASSFGWREVPNAPPPLPRGPELYDFATRQLASSPSELERQHIFLGLLADAPWDTPALLHRWYFGNHALIAGATGSGKSGRGVTSFARQTFAHGDSSIVYVPYKKDYATCMALAHYAGKAGWPVKFFTPVPGLATCGLKLLSDPSSLKRGPTDRSQSFIEAAGLSKGERHGAGHWTDQNELLLRKLFEHFPKIQSAGQCLEVLKDKRLRERAGINSHQVELSSHGVTKLEKLALIKAIDPVAGGRIPQSFVDYAITADDVLRGPGLYILYLPALINLDIARIVGRMFMRAVTNRMHEWAGPRVKHCYFIWDDAGPVMTERSLEVPLATSRSLGLGQVWATQSLSDFKNDDVDMTEKILTNTSLKLFMNISDPAAAKFLSEISGEVVARFKTLTQSITDTPVGQSAGVSKGEHEVLLKRIRAEHLARVNAHADLAVVCASPMVGFTQFMHPTIVQMPFSMTEKAFDDFEALGWWWQPDGHYTLRASDLEQPPPTLSSVPTPAPEPQPEPQPERRGQRRRTPKPPDPEQERRAAEYAERMRRFGRN